VAIEPLERRLLLLAPVGRDAALMHTMLQRIDADSVACANLRALALELERGAAALIVTEEALQQADGELARLVRRQPPWSDLPVLVLTYQGADSPEVDEALALLGNVTLLERPVRIAALESAVRSSLRARERQYQIREQLRERELADRRKDEFLAMLAHELRNPLAPIRNAVALLRMPGTQHMTGDLAQMIERQVTHMVRLVDDLMEVSRVTRGKIELRREAVDLKDIIESAAETCRPQIEAAQHELTVTLPPVPLVVHGDTVRLAQVFANLLNNAAKYTDSGGRISITAQRREDDAEVIVADTGIGIAGDMLPRVFDMFVQAEGNGRRAQSGLGIGLTLVRSLVALHGGTVAASSPGVGAGSRFTVRLPLVAPVVQRPIAKHSLQGLKSPPRVLVVDDNADAADSLGALLETLGAEVRVAYSGAEALRIYEEFRPAVLFLDLGMPEMDGYELARRIRGRPEARSAKIIAHTGWGRGKDRELTHAAGFDRHLVKPANVEALRAVLAAIDS
jgi:signal transduction histidine kinase